MLFSVRNLNNNSGSLVKDTKDINFKGLNAGKISHLSLIEGLSKPKKGLDELYYTIYKKIPPDFIKSTPSGDFYTKSNSILDTLTFPFVKLPKEAANFFTDKFNLKKSEKLIAYNNAKEKEAYERAMRGLLQNGDKFIDEFSNDPECNKKVVEKFYGLFDNNLAPDKAHYNTAHERTIVKVVSGGTAALIMGNDFYNKAILNGKTEKEAKKSAKKKRTQELLESGQEALSQYFMLSALSGFVNNSPLAAPVINTLLSLLFRITSRLSTGRPLKRIKPDKNSQMADFVSMKEFMDSAKEGKNIEAKKTIDKKNKKHLLCAKNILFACLASTVLGFSIKGIKSTKAFSSFLNLESIKKLKDKYRKMTVGEVWVDKNEAFGFLKALGPEFSDYKNFYSELFKKAFCDKNLVKDGKILLGEYEKTAAIPLFKVKASIRELLQVPLAPFKLITEFASYPYKAVHKILEGLKIVKKPSEIKYKNDYNILNTYMAYKEKLKANNNKIDENFVKEFSCYLEKNRISALNKETKSSLNNAAIGKTTQLLGTFASLYFAMCDDYNETLKQTNDTEKANKDARLRGLNKIIRMTTQIVFLKLNDIFKIPYAKSLLGAGLITAVCTVLTDSVSRVLSGMPFRKMDKAQLEQYNNSKKEGPLKNYYNLLDKLTD